MGESKMYKVSWQTGGTLNAVVTHFARYTGAPMPPFNNPLVFPSRSFGILPSQPVKLSPSTAIDGIASRNLRNKYYELTDHLGNVRTVVSDLRLAYYDDVNDEVIYDNNDITTSSWYYPFGWNLPGRGFTSSLRYRHGFQGQEIDPEYLDGAVFFKYRVHDPRLGRFLSIDPLAPDYPWNSPYAFSENRLIDGVELEGLEHLNLNNPNISCSQQNDDCTYNISLGGFHFYNVNANAINGQTYLDLGQHMYYNDGEWCNTGSRSSQVTEATLVGIKLIANVEALPQTPEGYVAPPMWTDPEQSWDVANTYQNCLGMCFAVSMARANQAYADLGVDNAVRLDVSSTDYRISGTILTNIPTQYRGYGVGGALAFNGYGTLVDNEGVWNGALQKGAALQYWNYGNMNDAIQDRFKSGGHSIFFESYIYGDNNEITGFNYVDYHGTGGTFYNSDSRIVVGANPIDP